MFNTDELLEQLENMDDGSKTPVEKIMIIVNYIAEHRDDSEQGDSLNDIIFVGHRNIVETVIEIRAEEGLEDANFNGGIEGQDDYENTITAMFLLEPATVIKAITKNQFNDIDYQHLSQEEQNDISRYRDSYRFLKDKDAEYAAFASAGSEKIDDMKNLAFKMTDGETVERAFATANKKSFLEWAFRSTSREYKDFKRTFQEYKDRTFEGGASRADVERTAKAYLDYKIPNFKGIEDINRLRGKDKHRALFCFNVLQATKESKTFDKKLNNLREIAENRLKKEGTYRTLQEMRIDGNAVNENIGEFIIPQQADFQDHLAHDIKENKIGDDIFNNEENSELIKNSIEEKTQA